MKQENIREILYALLVLAALVCVSALLGLLNVPALLIGAITIPLYIAYWMSRFGHTMRAQLALNDREYEKCIKICDEGIKILPSQTFLYRFAAASHLQLKNYEEASTYASEAIRMGDKFGQWSYLLRASANLSLGKFEAAIEDANTSAQIGDTKPDVHEVKLAALVSLHRYEEALTELEVFSSQTKDEQNILLYRAHILASMNQIEQASKECTKLFESISPDRVGHGLLIRASLLEREGKVEEAISEMNAAIELLPDAQACYTSRAYFLGRLGRLDEALADLEHAKDLPGPGTVGHREANLARLHLMKDENDKAHEFSKTARDLAPTASGVHATHGLILGRMGKSEEALAALNKAIELDKYNAEAYWFRAEVYEKLGDDEKSVQDQKIANDYGYRPYL